MKMTIECGTQSLNPACPWMGEMIWMEVGNYICVGFANLHSGWPVPVWRKTK